MSTLIRLSVFAQKTFSIDYHKVKSHTGIPGNELADTLAAAGVELYRPLPIGRFDFHPPRPLCESSGPTVSESNSITPPEKQYAHLVSILHDASNTLPNVQTKHSPCSVSGKT